MKYYFFIFLTTFSLVVNAQTNPVLLKQRALYVDQFLNLYQDPNGVYKIDQLSSILGSGNFNNNLFLKEK